MKIDKKISLLLCIAALCLNLTAQPYLQQNFEQGLGSWQAVSMNTENDEYFGLNGLQTSAHSGNYYFQFSSYTSADNYNQYLISPKINLDRAFRVEFYCIDARGHGEEEFQLMSSSSDSLWTSFTPVSATIYPSEDWTYMTFILPAETKYIAFHYTAYYEYMMGIDDVTITPLDTNPEITLSAMQIPEFVSLGADFPIIGTVLNQSASTLHEFNVTYAIDGVNTSSTISGISVNSGENYTFTHPIPAHISTGGTHSIVLTVDNPNGIPDNMADNVVSNTILICDVLDDFPYDMGFEQGLECWRTLSLSSQNTVGITHNGYPHSGNSYFRFSSWYVAADYTQYLISPQFAFTAPMGLSFYAKDLYGYGNESFQLMVSSTDDSLSSFSNLGEVISPNNSWRRYDFILPANTKYLLFKYTAVGQYQTGIDDIRIMNVPDTPEFELSTIQVPYMVPNNTNFAINAVAVNHSSVPITNFTVSYTIEGQTVVDTIDGVNLIYEIPYEFTIPTMANIPNAGEYAVSVTISLPNGVQDDMSDNTRSTTLEVYEASASMHRKVLMEHFSTASCPNCIAAHQRIENVMSEGFEDDVIWVTHHAGYYTDRLTVPVSETMTTFYNGGTYAPAVMLDRTYWGEYPFAQAMGVPDGPVFFPYSDFDVGLSSAVSVPAYVTVTFSEVSYDSVSRRLDVEVSGEVAAAFDTVEPRLNVWLMEDEIIADGDTIPGHGPKQSNADADFLHNHVIRELLNANQWGEDDVVPVQAGSSYSKTYSFVLPQKYIDAHCYLVAFVSEGNHSDINNCKVYNAEKSARLRHSDTPASVDNMEKQHSAATIQLYPNPAHNYLYLKDFPYASCRFAVYNMTAQQILSGETNGVIPVSQLSAGVYVLELQLVDGVQRTKFIVQ